MAKIVCTDYLKLEDQTEFEVPGRPTVRFTPGVFWLPGETYVVSGSELDALLGHFPENFQEVDEDL